MELQRRSPKRSSHKRSPKSQVCSIRHNDRATIWEKYDEDGWTTVNQDLKYTAKTKSDLEPISGRNREEKTNDVPCVESDQETSDCDSSRGFWSPAMSDVLRKRYSTFGKRTPRTISRILKHHRESERNRHHGINATIQAICEQIPGHVTTPVKKETKILKLQKIINYICHLEENIHHLADELDLKLDFKKVFLSSQCNDDCEDGKLLSPKSPPVRRTKKMKSLLHRQQVRNKGKRRIRIKISSPTVDSTTPDRPKQSGKCSRRVQPKSTVESPKSTVESPKTPIRGKGKRNWWSSTPRKYNFSEKSTINEDDLESLGIDSPLLPTFLPSPDTTTLLSTEDCDQVLSVIDCPTPFSEADTSLTEFSDSDLFLEDVLDSVENVDVVPKTPWEKYADTENGATLVSVEIPAHLVADDSECDKKDEINKIFETGRHNLAPNSVFSSGVSAFHSYAKEPGFPAFHIPERDQPEMNLELPRVVSEVEVLTTEESEDAPIYVKQEPFENYSEGQWSESPVSKRFQTIKGRTETTPTIKGFLKSGKGIASEKHTSRSSSACSIASTASGSPLRRSRRRPKPIRRSPFLPLSNIVVRDGEVTIKKEKEEESCKYSFYDNADSESEDEENVEPLIMVHKVDNRKTTWMNGFMMYSRMHRRKYIMENRGTHTSNISKKMGQDWKRLSPEEKEPYSEQARTYADRYLKPRFQAEFSQEWNEQNEPSSTQSSYN